MNAYDFEVLSKELKELVDKIPLKWGAIQNNIYDSRINMFSIFSYEELERQLSIIRDDNIKNYFRRRWFLWQCARCDEYLLCETGFGEPNPNKKSKEYDVKFLGSNELKFDVKGSLIPRNFRNQNINDLIKDPSSLAQWMFANQSTGVRFDIQNRLFIIHHSLVQDEREMYVRCEWQVKRNAYKQYVELLKSNKRFIYTNGVKADFIWLIEETEGVIKPYFFE